MIVITHDIPKIRQEAKKYEEDLRGMFRTAMKYMSKATMRQIRNDFDSLHKRYGDTGKSVRDVSMKGGWERYIMGSIVIRYIEEGTRPRGMGKKSPPPFQIEKYATIYGITPSHLVRGIRRGTRAYGKIVTPAVEKVWRRREEFYRRAFKEKGALLR